MRFKRAVTGCVCVLSLVALAGCGAGGGGQQADEETTKEPVAGKVIQTIEVKETEFRLDPAEITLEKPGTYVFKADNIGGTTHALEIEGQGIEKETRNLDPGQSAELRVTLKAGKYEVYCPVGGHKEQGMEGTVTVGRDSSGPGNGSGGY